MSIIKSAKNKAAQIEKDRDSTEELLSLNNQLSEARNYAEAIVATVREPLVVLDKNFRVKTANSSFYTTF